MHFVCKTRSISSRNRAVQIPATISPWRLILYCIFYHLWILSMKLVQYGIQVSQNTTIDIFVA